MSAKLAFRQRLARPLNCPRVGLLQPLKLAEVLEENPRRLTELHQRC